MRKFTIHWALVWIFAVVLITLLAVQAFAQDSTARPKPCPCDSLFVRRVNYRIDRQLDINGTVWSALHDQKEVNATLEARIDSLRAMVREWTQRQIQTEQPKTKKRKP
jgi:hypothetical protein